MKTPLIRLSLAAITLTLATSALAEDNPILEKLDTNHDGYVTKEEAKEAEEHRLMVDFDKYDLDNDGKLNADELDKLRRQEGT